MTKALHNTTMRILRTQIGLTLAKLVNYNGDRYILSVIQIVYCGWAYIPKMALATLFLALIHMHQPSFLVMV